MVSTWRGVGSISSGFDVLIDNDALVSKIYKNDTHCDEAN
jgi:hypothetical protein